MAWTLQMFSCDFNCFLRVFEPGRGVQWDNNERWSSAAPFPAAGVASRPHAGNAPRRRVERPRPVSLDAVRDGLVFVGTWGTESRHPMRRTTVDREMKTREGVMAETVGFEQLTHVFMQRIGFDTHLSAGQLRYLRAAVIDELRLIRVVPDPANGS